MHNGAKNKAFLTNHTITLKAGVKLPGWLWGGGGSSVARAPAAKAGGPGFNSQWLPWVFSLPAGLLVLMG